MGEARVTLAGASPVVTAARITALRGLALLMWACELTVILAPSALVETVSQVALVCFLVLSVLNLRHWTLVITGVAAVLCAGAVAAGADPWRAVDRLAQATRLAAFLECLLLLRAVVEMHPRLTDVQDRFEAIAARDRDGGILLVSHVLGSVLTLGVMSIFAPIMRRAQSDARLRAAQFSMRGFSLIVLWSPFTVAMATVNASIPHLALWKISAVGLAVSGAAILSGLLLGQFHISPRSLREMATAVAAVGVPLTLLTLMTVLVSAVLHLGAIMACILIITIFGAGWVATMGPAAAAGAARQTWTSLDRLGDEFMLFTVSVVLAGLMLDVPMLSDLLRAAVAEGRPPFLMLMAGAMLVALLPMAGIHMILPASICISAFVQLGPFSQSDELIFIALILTGWCFGSMLSPASIALLTASTLFGVPRRSLALGANLRFLLTMFAAVSAIGGVTYSLL
ncbi:hypothetical protein DLJ53_29725 [Acuticoccus sediminis]|uniref:Uncharacterized protein n=1 Tax=Acuticoccus sediminis TaxID=2184697 RepID=A0A8B2NF18_9HYPH|nr:hypothetical protein DLJ53_29725 [Acuticoccus sediminis]